MSDPVTVFMLVVAGLLVVGTIAEQVFVRTGLPAVIWLVALGVLVRLTGIVPLHVITGIAPFFAALALVIILFDAGTNLTGGTGEAALAPVTRKRAQLLAFIGFAVTAVVVALFSQGLAALDILPRWGWAHAFMLGSLIACGASEVAQPSLLVRRGLDEVTSLLRRESAITKALAVTGTVVCLDLLSPRVATGGAGLAMVAGFGFALAFGTVAGMLWVVALQRLAGDGDGAEAREARNYGFTLAVMVVLYVLSEAAGGAGALSVLVFGAMLGNAGGLLGVLRRGAGEDPGASEAVHAALGGHARTIQFVRTLMFAMVGLTLAPPWGPLVMGVVLALLLLVTRLAVGRFTLAGLDHHERAAVGASAPRGMASVALVTLPLAHAVPGAEEMVALTFSAVTVSVLLFTIGLREIRPPRQLAAAGAAAPAVAVRPSLGSLVAAEVAASHPGSPVPNMRDAVAPTLAQVPGLAGLTTPSQSGTAMRAATPSQSGTAMRAATPSQPVSPMRAATPIQSGTAMRAATPIQSGTAMRAATPIRPAEPGLDVLPDMSFGAGVSEQARTGEATADIDLAAGTAPTIAPSSASPRAHAPAEPSDDPLANAMARALARRPEEVTQMRLRPTQPEFTPFPGGTEEDALSLLGEHDDDDKAGG